eukprot:s5317_g12.t1
MQYPPDPLDKWIARDIQLSPGRDYVDNTTGEALSTEEGEEYEQYQRCFHKRCKLGGKADRLVRIVDRYMPRIAEENRIFVMRFPDKVGKMLRSARGIRRKIRARRGQQQGEAATPPKEEPPEVLRPANMGEDEEQCNDERYVEDIPPDWGDSHEGLNMAETQGSDQQSSEGEESHGRWGQRGDLQTQEEVKECSQKGPPNRRGSHPVDLLNQRGSHQLHKGGIPSLCCRADAGTRLGIETGCVGVVAADTNLFITFTADSCNVVCGDGIRHVVAGEDSLFVCQGKRVTGLPHRSGLHMSDARVAICAADALPANLWRWPASRRRGLFVRVCHICGLFFGGDCDDNNTEPGDGCSSTCEVEIGWFCKRAGTGVGFEVCLQTCLNGIIDPGEDCDDANTFKNDGCANCILEPGWRCSGPSERFRHVLRRPSSCSFNNK